MNVQNAHFSPANVSEEDVHFHSGEYLLHGRFFVPPLAPEKVVIINAATDVPAYFYHAFARWLAREKGYACLTYDYRGFGKSARDRDAKVLLSDWAVHDAQAARDFVRRRFRASKIWIIGHSVGAMGLPFQERLDEIERVICVASGMVHVRDHPYYYQPLARLFWFGHVPLVVAAFGRVPKWLGLGAELPGPVYWQWRRWCTQKSFFANDFGRALPMPDWTGLQAPVKFVAISDDAMVPPKAVWRLMQCFQGAWRTQLVLKPESNGLKHIGHIHAFAERNKACWEDVIA